MDPIVGSLPLALKNKLPNGQHILGLPFLDSWLALEPSSVMVVRVAMDYVGFLVSVLGQLWQFAHSSSLL